MSKIESIYHKSPVVVQNIMNSIKGFQIRQVRYSKHTWKTLDFLKKSQFWEVDQFEDYQLEKLKKLVNHAINHVPFYKERYTALKLNSSTIKNLFDINLLPIISKEDFRQHNNSLVSTHIHRKKMWVSYTSGTTGTPLSAYRTHNQLQETMAFMERLYGWYNPKLWRSRASFTGKLIVDPNNSKGPFHRVNHASNQYLFSSHHLVKSNIDKYINELSLVKPEQIDGIASSIYAIADHIIRHDRFGAIQPKVVIPTSETIWPHIRERIEKAFQCKVANQYGSQEGAPLAYECPHGGFHISPESGIFEILHPDSSPCRPGESGRLVVTSFLSEGTPLIRYDIGDVASWKTGVCICGRNMPMLETIEGRIDDMFFTTERGVISRVDSAFKNLPNAIKATQVAQVGLNQFQVRIVPDRNTYREEYADTLVENLHYYLGNSAVIDVKLVSEIQRTSGGKLRAMVNECKTVQNDILTTWNSAN